MAMYWRVKRIPANAVVGTTKTHIGVLENVTSKSTSHEHRLIRTLTEWTRPQLWTTRTKTTRKQRYCFGGVLGCVYSTTDTRPTHAVKSSILHSIANPLGPNPLWALRNLCPPVSSRASCLCKPLCFYSLLNLYPPVSSCASSLCKPLCFYSLLNLCPPVSSDPPRTKYRTRFGFSETT